MRSKDLCRNQNEGYLVEEMINERSALRDRRDGRRKQELETKKESRDGSIDRQRQRNREREREREKKKKKTQRRKRRQKA